MRRILIVTDAWLPQVNGVVRSIEALLREAPSLGVEIDVLSSAGFRTAPVPTYRQVRVAVTRPSVVARRIEELKPDFVHIATEGPLGHLRLDRLPQSRAPLHHRPTIRASPNISPCGESRRAAWSTRCFAAFTTPASA